MKNLISIERIKESIYIIRGKKVMIDFDLAVLYGVSTKYLNKQVKRNIERFPDDFMFRLNSDEYLRFQIGTSKRGGRRYLPLAFTEQGIAMLSSVLRSKRAIQVNIQIMRAFIALKHLVSAYKGLKDKVDFLERKYDRQFKVVFDAIRELITPLEEKKTKIGFLRGEQE